MDRIRIVTEGARRGHTDVDLVKSGFGGEQIDSNHRLM